VIKDGFNNKKNRLIDMISSFIVFFSLAPKPILVAIDTVTTINFSDKKVMTKIKNLGLMPRAEVKALVTREKIKIKISFSIKEKINEL
jgi:hypothetical protein